MSVSKAKKVFIYDNLAGGLNTYSSESDVDDDQTPDARNFQPFGKSGIERISGTTQVGDTVDSRVVGLASFYNNATGVRGMLRMSGTKMKVYDELNDVWDELSTPTYTVGKETNFVQIGNYLFAHNQVDNMTYFDGASMFTPANGVKLQFGIEYKGYQWGAGNTSNPDTLYRSTAADPRDFVGGGADTGQTYTVGLGDGQKITGLAKWSEYLIVFKERSTYYLSLSVNDSGSAVTTIKLVNPDIGAVAHRTIDNVENDVYFLSYQGVYVIGNEPNFFNVIRTNELSASVTDYLREIQPNQLKLAAAIYSSDHRFRIALAEGNSTFNNVELVAERKYNNSWWINRGKNINCYNEYVNSDLNENLYYGDDDDGKVYLFDAAASSNAGSAIDASFLSKRFAQGDQQIVKTYKDCWFEFKSSSGIIRITIYIDGEIASGFPKTVSLSQTPDSAGWGTGIWGQEPVTGEIITVTTSGSVEDTKLLHYFFGNIGIVGRNIQFQLEQSDLEGVVRMVSFRVRAFAKSDYESIRRA